MLKIVTGILMMFAIAMTGFADTPIQSPDWDTVTMIGEPLIAAAETEDSHTARTISVAGEDHATHTNATTDSWEGFGNATPHLLPNNDGYHAGPFEVGWQSSTPLRL